MIDVRQTNFDLADREPWAQYDAVLERCVSHSRALASLQILGAMGVPCVNNAHVAQVCGSKLETSLALAEAALPVPRVKIAFTPDSALEAIEAIGYPVVLKPAVGFMGTAAGKDQRPRGGRGGSRTQRDARLVPSQHLLRPGVHRQTGRATYARLSSVTKRSAASRAVRRTGSRTRPAAVQAQNCPVTRRRSTSSRGRRRRRSAAASWPSIFWKTKTAVCWSTKSTTRWSFATALQPTGVDIPGGSSTMSWLLPRGETPALNTNRQGEVSA